MSELGRKRVYRVRGASRAAIAEAITEERKRMAAKIRALGCVTGMGVCSHPMCPRCAIADMIEAG